MAVIRELRAYVDDSGDEPDPQHEIIALGCYLSQLDRWKVFEREWREILGDNHVPYLHMKEFWNEKCSVYRELKKNGQKQATFFSDLAGVVKRNTEFCTTHTVKLDDLKKFNSEYNMSLSAYALALYGCLMYLRLEEKNNDLTVIIDKTTKAQNQANLAEAYAKSDTYADLKTDGITIIPLKKDDSFKTVLPIQAVDWLAWEVRKNSSERLTWKPSEEDRKTIVGVYRS
jgi:Protein of unknown function (DUF3800)